MAFRFLSADQKPAACPNLARPPNPEEQYQGAVERREGTRRARWDVCEVVDADQPGWMGDHELCYRVKRRGRRSPATRSRERRRGRKLLAGRAGRGGPAFNRRIDGCVVVEIRNVGVRRGGFSWRHARTMRRMTVGRIAGSAGSRSPATLGTRRRQDPPPTP